MGKYVQLKFDPKPYTRKEVIAYVQIKLRTNIKWATASALSIYKQQKLRERQTLVTKGTNHVGFDKLDSARMSVICSMINKGKPLSKPQEQMLLRRMPRYAVQVINLSNVSKLMDGVNKYYQCLSEE